MLKTPPNTGTYYPPKVMLDGQWRYMVGVTEWHDHEHDAREAHRLEAENATLRHALHAVVNAIDQENARGAIRDTLWMPKEYALNCTVVEFIGTVLEG